MKENEKKISCKVELNLYKEDIRAVCEKAGAAGLTLGELLENFIADLICGATTNGSDERMYAEEWFNRCWFGMLPEKTFLKYLIECEDPEEFIENLDSIASYEADVEGFEKELEAGYMIDRKGNRYTWEDLTDGKGNLAYKSKEEWEAQQRECIEEAKEEITFYRESIADSWRGYLQVTKKPEPYDEAVRKVREFAKQLRSYLE